MQTFLPFSDFDRTARCLDRQRLGNQRCEAKVILKTLNGESDGWKNHPAVRMWRGHELALCHYAIAICREWRQRGYRDQQLGWFVAHAVSLPCKTPDPPWLGDVAIHSSHRSNLLRKDPEWYGSYGWTEPPDLPYFWPV